MEKLCFGHAYEAFSFYPPAHICDWWAKEACNLYGGVEVQISELVGIFFKSIGGAPQK